MILILYIQCIYKAQISGKKTNRCQKVNVKKWGAILLQTSFFDLNLVS